MKNKILSGWTFSRLLYLSLGSFILIQSIMDQQWLGAAIGAYFAAMGLFAFGCAGGNCSIERPAVDPVQKMESNPELDLPA